MEHHREDDIELIERYRNGDERAFQRLHTTYTPLIRRACRRQGLSSTDIDDVEQDVWSAFCRYPPVLRRADGFGAWLWVTAVHVCHKRRRRLPMVPLDEAGDVAAESGSAPDTLALRAEDRRTAGTLLSSIRSDERRLLELVFVDNRPNYRAIGAELQRPVGSIGPTRARILRKLRATAEDAGLVA